MTTEVRISDEDTDEDEAKSIILPLTKSSSNLTIKKPENEETTELVLCDCIKSCIHSIARSGNHKKLSQVIVNGADLWSRDVWGRTALHWASSIGNKEKSINCVKLILDKVYFAGKLDDEYLEDYVNIQDYHNKATALYLAAKYENKEVCECLIKAFTDVTLKSKTEKTALEMIYKHIPEALVFMLDSAMESSTYLDEAKSTANLYIRTIIGQVPERDVPCKEMSMLANILYSPLNARSKFLSHTLITVFLWIQWRKYQPIIWGIRIIKSIWLLIYFVLMVYFYREKCPYNSTSSKYYQFNWFQFYPNEQANATSKKLAECEREILLFPRMISGFIIVVTTLVVIFELYQVVEYIKAKKFHLRARFVRFLFRMKFRYIHKVLLIFCIYTSCGAIFNSHVMFLADETYYMVASIGVFLSWIVLFLEIGKVPKYRVHIEMLTTILKTFVRVMLTYMSILIAFAMAFCILLPGIPSNSSMLQAILKMLVIMAGEPGYETIFYNSDSQINSPSYELSIIFYGLCIALVTIVMLNYLIGLTVCDIQSLQDDAEVWRCSTIISQVFILESFLFKLPCSLKKFVIGNGCRTSQCKFQISNPDFCFVDINKLPKNVQRGVHNWNLKQVQFR